MEDIQSLLAKEASQEEQVRTVYNDLGEGLFKASGMKKRVKDVIEGIKKRITGKRRNILKD